MHDLDGSTPKPSLTWALIQVFALHNTHYRTSRPPAGFRCGGLPTPSNIDALTATGITHGCATRGNRRKWTECYGFRGFLGSTEVFGRNVTVLGCSSGVGTVPSVNAGVAEASVPALVSGLVVR